MSKPTLSAPVFQLKRKAKLLSRDTGITLNEALNQIAREEGFHHWSLLANRFKSTEPDHNANIPGTINLAELPEPGDLILVAARPGQGKTIASLEMLIAAVRAGRRGVFFTLEYNQTQAAEKLLSLANNHSLGCKDQETADQEIASQQINRNAAYYQEPSSQELSRQKLSSQAFSSQELGRLEIDSSDDISAPYVIQRLSTALPGTVIVIDYLQLLDQKRSNPDLNQQLHDLKQFATKRGICMIVISQIHRSFDLSTQHFPTIENVWLPNPVDLGVFNKTCFLHNRQIVCSSATTPVSPYERHPSP